MKDETDNIIDIATVILCMILALLVGLTAYDTIFNAPEEVPIIIKGERNMIHAEYLSSVSDLLYVLNNDNYKIYTK